MRHFVLIVEDDDDARETLQMVLESSGYDVLTARNGREALEILRNHPDDVALILLDVLMPVMDGWQFLSERSHSEGLEDVPTVVLSGAHPSNPISSHAAACLLKPVDTAELLKTVRKYSDFGPS
jgi:CheY-like chemotaxis protein